LAEDAQFMDILETWTRADNFWVRRAALASTVVLRRANYDPAIMRLLNQRTLGICLALLDDEEHYVRKAVDWAVREVIGRDYESGKRWLMERAGAELSGVAYSTLKKSAKKLTPEDQEQFLQKLE
jgi:3-methyladenine DNA glycosylase AlkD